MQKISPCLWFDGNAEEAANFYTSIFEDAKILDVTHYGDAGPGEPGSVLTVTFTLQGQFFMALNGGPDFKFTEAVSLMVDCKDQQEIDYYWSKLLEGGGREQMCGWLKDKYGLSWQIVPSIINEMLTDPDPEKSNRVMQAVMQMVKLDIPTLQKAYEGS